MTAYPFNNYQNLDEHQVYKIIDYYDDLEPAAYVCSEYDISDVVAYLEFQSESLIDDAGLGGLSNLAIAYALICLYGCREAYTSDDLESAIIISRFEVRDERCGPWFKSYVEGGCDSRIARSDIELLGVLGPYIATMKRSSKEFHKNHINQNKIRNEKCR